MNLLISRQRINQLMSIFVTQVKGSTAMTMTDINHVAETVLIPIFREVYGYKSLKNLNSEEGSNYPGVDLGDEDARVAIQVTSTADSEKVKHTLRQFVKYDQHKKYDRLIVYILTEKQNSYSGSGFSQIIQGRFGFDKDQDILDFKDILAQVDAFQLDRVRAVEQILEENFGDHNAVQRVQEDALANLVEQRQLAQEAEQARVTQTEMLRLAQQETAQQQTQQIASLINDAIRQLSGPGILQPKISAEETAFSAKLDIARELLKDGQPGMARKILLELRGDAARQTVSLDTQFRITTQLGACAYELEDMETAVTELKKALAFKPDDPMALTNAATAASITGDIDEALRLTNRIRKLEPQSPIATSIQIGVLFHQDRLAEIERMIADEPWITADAMCLATLGDVEFQKGQYARAEQYFRAATAADDNNPLPYLLLAQSILIPLQKIMHDDPPLPGKEEASLLSKRHEAASALSTVISLTEEWYNPKLRHIALSNRAGVLASLDQLDEAEQDCDKVLAENKHHDTALRNKGQILLRRGESERAIHFLEQIQGEDEKKSAALPLAGLYSSLERFAQVVQVLTPLWNASSQEHDGILIANMLMNAHSHLGAFDEAAGIEAKLLREWPDNPNTLAVLSSRRMQQNKPDEAVALLEHSLGIAQGRIRDWMAYELARLHYKLGNFTKAVETYKLIVDTTKDSVELREYLYCLYKTEQFEDALHIAQELRDDGPPLLMISEIEVSILEQIGDLNKAADILYQLQVLEPEKFSHSVRLVNVEARRDNKEASRAAVQRVSFEAIKEDPELLMRMAFARNRLEMPEVLRFAYQARRIAHDDVNTHTAYVQLFPQLHNVEEATISIGPSVVGMDCAVHLVRNGQTVVFILLDEEPLFESEGEIGPVHPYTSKLRGLQVGNQVTLQEGPFGSIGYEVLEIQSKYVFAFQASIKRFETGQLQNDSIFVGNINDAMFLPSFKANLDQRREQGEAIRIAYWENQFPLCLMAEWLGRSQFDVWSALVYWPGGRINASSGNPLEETSQLALLEETDALVLETSALFAIQYLGLGSAMVRAFSKLLVAQSTLDALSSYIEEPLDAKPHRSIWSAGDRYFYQELSAEDTAQQKQFVRDVVEFIQSSTIVLPAVDLLTINQGLVRTLGQTAAAIALAHGQNVPLYSDDFVLRCVAQNDQKVAGVWTQAVLKYMREQSILSRDQYNEAIENLVIGNYYFVDIDINLFQWILERDALKITPQTARVFGALAAPYTDENKALGIVARVSVWLWLQPSDLQTKLAVLDVTLGSLITGRDGLVTLAKLTFELALITALLPMQLQLICSAIDAWAAARLTR